jgi:hypothetical protein
MTFADDIHGQLSEMSVNEKRSFDTIKIYERKRKAHACIMSIVFIVLYPLGAISTHLPIQRVPFLKNTYLKNKIMAMHVPIQIIAFVMMIGGMALGIRIGHDLEYLKNPVHHHVVIGLVVTCTIIIFQPIMGMLQHWHFKKTGGKGIFAFLHRWIGRCAIILGVINDGLGFQLASLNVIIHKRSYIRNFVIFAVLGFIWLSVVLYDRFGGHRSRTSPDGEEQGIFGMVKKPVGGSAIGDREEQVQSQED